MRRDDGEKAQMRPLVEGGELAVIGSRGLEAAVETVEQQAA